MSNNIEASIKSTEEEMITPSAETNENTCEVRSESCDQFVGPALRRHSGGDSADVGLGLPSAVDAADDGLELPSAGDAADVRLELPSAASPVMAGSQPAADDLGRQTVTAEPSSSGPTEIVVVNYAGPTFRCYIALLNKAITSPGADDVIADAPFASSPAESSPSACLPAVSTPLQVSPYVSPPQQSSHGYADSMRRRTCSMPNVHVRFGVDDVRHVSSPQKLSRGLVDPPRRRACSMPNIYVRFRSSRDSSQLADARTAVQTANVPCDETEQAAEAPPKRPKRRTALWKRTKRFFRRMFCCA